jgi:hypothetical protein
MFSRDAQRRAGLCRVPLRLAAKIAAEGSLAVVS